MLRKPPQMPLKPDPEHADPARLVEGLAALPALERVREASSGLAAYLVGGAVRDLLLGRSSTNIDLVVEGDAGEVASRLGGEPVTHERFETATARVDGVEIDLATARTETYAHPGALPEVRPATLAEDLARRDFTINAMAVQLSGAPELIDPHGGLADLGRGMLRALHERSFVDDPTRALRGARYAARLGFRLEDETERLARAADLGTVSGDRVEAELRKLAAEADPRPGFELLDEWGLVTLPEGAGELIAAVSELLSAPSWSEVCERPDAVLAVAQGRVGDAAELAAARPERPSEAVEAARGRSGVELAAARAMGAEWLDRYVGEWRDVELEITGEDLLATGVLEGPSVGRGLRAALARKLDGEFSGREAELEAALEAARGS
jgi:tRNA nucleotidyltransferase (CCA-adding enzyme)